MSWDTLGSGAALNTPENLRTLRKVTKDGKLMLGVTIGREQRNRQGCPAANPLQPHRMPDWHAACSGT